MTPGERSAGQRPSPAPEASRTAPQRVLVVSPSWIGDTVMAQPLLRRLHERRPGITIDVLAAAWTAPILKRMPEVADVIANPFGHGEVKIGERLRLARRIRERRYDRAVVLPNSLKSALVPLFAGIRLRTGFVGEFRYGFLNDARRLDANQYPLMVERYALLAEPKGHPLQRPLPPPRLEADPQARSALLQRLGLDTGSPAAAFCVGAEYGPAKRWPARHYGALARALARRGWQVWLVGSARDRPVADDVATASEGAARNLCGATGLGEALDLLSAASLVATNDSGLMHLAAAAGRPLVALYGSSSPGFTPPLSSAARVISLGLPCSPCFERVCPLGHLRCLEDLDPDRVLAEIDALLAQQGDAK